MQKPQEAASYIRSNIKSIPKLAIILGSGLGDFSTQLTHKVSIPYHTIPHFFTSSVTGHSNELIVGTIENKGIICMKGRIHYYETGDMEKVILPIRLLQSLGIKTIIFTNAAGAINADFYPGDLIVIRDHINFLGTNPLIGNHDKAYGERFIDITNAYDRDLRKILTSVFSDLGITYKEGVYVAVTGPSYETPAEIRMFKTMGADLVGMSTVPSVIVAKQAGMKVAALACVTNKAAGITDKVISHEEVIEAGKMIQDKLTKVLIKFIKEL